MDRDVKRRAITVMLALFVITTIVIITQTVFFSFPLTTPSAILYAAGQYSGLLGLLALSLLILSGESARFFDRYYGMDTIIRTQKRFSYIVAIFILLHPAFFILSSSAMLTYIQSWPQTLPASIALASGVFAMILFIGVMASSILYKRISYTAWQYIHIGIYLLLILSAYHAFNEGGTIRSSPILQILFGIIILGIIIGAVYRTTYKIRQYRAGTARVTSITQETDDTFTLSITPPRPIRYCAGQFCFLRIDGKRLYARHPFTVSSAPHEEPMRFTIKQSGRFTTAASELSPGDTLHLEGPFGRFTIPERGRPLVFIAGGVGITPFRSIIEDHLHRGIDTPITLLYGSRTAKDIIFKERFDAITAPWFAKAYVLSQEEQDGYEYGYIDEERIRAHVKNPGEATYYLCGPEPMKRAVIHALKELGVPPSRIHTEDFFW